MLKRLYKVRKPHTQGWLWMITANKWDKVGKYFTEADLLKLFKRYFDEQPSNESFPAEWEVFEYHLIETKQITPDKFVKWKSEKKPFIKGV